MIIETPENKEYQELVDTCFTLYDAFKKSTYRKDKLTEIKEGIRRYEQDAPKVTFPWDNAYNLYLPLLTITIDNLEPRLVAGLVGRDPIVAFGDHLKGSQKILEDWYNDELKKVVKVKDAAMKYVHTLLKEGTYYCIPEYDITEKEMKDFTYDETGNVVFDEGSSEPVIRTEMDTVFEGGKINVIPFSDVFCADDLGTMEEWELADKIIKVRPTYSELFQNKDAYMNIGPWLLSDKSQRKIRELDKSPDQIVAGVDVTGKETIDCIECHISFPMANIKENPKTEEEKRSVSDFTEERIIVTIAIRTKTIIKIVHQSDLNMNNESLIKRGRMFPEEGRSYGTSMYGKMKAIQDGASSMFSLLMNTVVICMMPWYFYEEGSGVEGKQDIFPGGGVKVKDINKIKFAEYKVNPRDYIEFINLWFDLWERIGGITDPQIGKTSSKTTTATEVLTVVEEGNIKNDYQSSTFREEFLQILRTLYDLYYQYMPYDKMLDPKTPFPRALMRRPNNFRLTSSTEKANKLIERKENEDVFNLLRQDPLTDPLKIIVDLLSSYGRDNPEEYINPEIGHLMQLITEDPNVLGVITGVVQQYMAEAQGEQGAQGGV
jgi:hypothetical protein